MFLRVQIPYPNNFAFRASDEETGVRNKRYVHYLGSMVFEEGRPFEQWFMSGGYRQYIAQRGYVSERECIFEGEYVIFMNLGCHSSQSFYVCVSYDQQERYGGSRHLYGLFCRHRHRSSLLTASIYAGNQIHSHPLQAHCRRMVFIELY